MKRKLYTIIFTLAFFMPLVSTAQVVINEFMASNQGAHWDVDKQSYSDWVELYNDSKDTIDISGFYLSDNLNKTKKWQIPTGTKMLPKSYLVIWADKQNSGLHASFSLSMSKDELGFYNKEGEVQDEVRFRGQYENLSFGRIEDGEEKWGYLHEATPGTANSEFGTMNLKFNSAPSFSLDGGYITKGARLELSSNSSGAIRYTLNGADVSSTSAIYNEVITIDSTVVVKARVYSEDLLPSKTSTQLFVTEASSRLPIISVVTDPANLWDDKKGIYVVGTNGTRGGGDKIVANYWQNWERPANVEMYETDGSRAFVSDANIKLISPFVRKFPQKPISVKFNDYVKHQIFPDKEAILFRSLSLRNSGNDMALTFFRDGMMQSLLIGQMDIDYQGYRPAILYLNGRYWGIHNIREKTNTDYVVSNHSVDRDHVDMLEDWTARKIRGSNEEYYVLRKFIVEHDLALPENYEYVANEIDIDEYINYMIAEIYFNNMDWPGGNIKFWRSHDEGSKWRYVLFDVDFGFGLYRGFDNNTMAYAASENSVVFGKPLHSLVSVIFRKLLENPEFKSEFIQRFAGYLNTTFAPERVSGVIDSIRMMVADEMPRHIDKWGKKAGISSLESWEKNIEITRTFGNNRPEHQRQHIIDHFKLSGKLKLEVTAENGRVVINGNNSPLNQSGIYFQGVPMQIKAIPDPGFRFLKWEGVNNSEVASITLNLTESALLTAVFVAADQHLVPGKITEKVKLLDKTRSYYAKGDIVIEAKGQLILGAGVRLLMSEGANIIVRGNLRIDGTPEEPALIRANTESGYKSWGALCFEYAKTKCIIDDFILMEATHGANKIKYNAAIASDHSDVSLDNVVVVKCFGQPFYSEYGDIKIKNCKMRTAISSDIINIKYGTAKVENCDLQGNNQPNTDGIDYDGVSKGIIRGNTIYDFKGSNSDGIDLGEGTIDVLIEDNSIRNCTDKGISVGQKSTATIIRNVIVGCNQGIGIKDSSSFATIDKCVFYKNKTGIAVFQKNNNRGGGGAVVTNTIISQSKKASVSVDRYSELDVSYSLSDMDMLRGHDNMYADPQFVNPDTNNFDLLEGSPGLNAGSRRSILDLGKTRNHLGVKKHKKPAKLHIVYYVLLGAAALAGVYVFGK